MANTYNSLQNAFQNLIKENTKNNSFIPTLLVLLTIPLSYAVNSVAVGLFLIIALLYIKKTGFTIQKTLLLPVLLYLLMAISYFWSIDATSTLSALSKEIPLLIIPIGFFIYQKHTSKQKQKIIAVYSYTIVAVAVYFLLRAVIRYFSMHETSVFFYHGENDNDYGLVPKLLNAIHVSVFAAVAFFYFVTKTIKTKKDTFLASLLFGFILLLSSKNIIIMVLLLLLIYVFFFSRTAQKLRLRNLIVFGLLLGIIFSVGKIKQRFREEFKTNSSKSLSANVIEAIPPEVHYVSLKEAWTKPSFTANDYFPGTAFRVYQLRVFVELIKEEPILWTGYGLNASKEKLIEKEKKYNLYRGYGTFNFHNQYIQNFAELGFFGFLLLIIMLIINVKNAYSSKDFVHFAFAVLMISLFLTESFLWRQRGVVFFTMLFCLFNSGILHKNSETE
jgi:O-antigen ligase